MDRLKWYVETTPFGFKLLLLGWGIICWVFLEKVDDSPKSRSRARFNVLESTTTVDPLTLCVSVNVLH